MIRGALPDNAQRRFDHCSSRPRQVQYAAVMQGFSPGGEKSPSIDSWKDSGGVGTALSRCREWRLRPRLFM